MLEFLFLLLPIAFYSGWQSARKRYKKRNQPQRQNKPLVKGINYLLNEEPDKALAFFIRHPDIDEYTAETFLLLGNSFRNRGEIDRALKVHQNLVARPNLNASQRQAAMFALGEDFLAAGMLDKAEKVFKELLQKKPDDKAAFKPLREIYEQLRQWQQAIDIAHGEVDESIAKKRLIAHYHCEIAENELKKGNLYNVEKQIKLAAKHDKAFVRVNVLKGDVAYYEEKLVKARKIYFEVIKQEPYLLGMLFPKLLKLAEKTADFSKLYDFLFNHYRKTQDDVSLESLLTIANSQPTYFLDNGKNEVKSVIEAELANNKLGLKTILQSLDVLMRVHDERPALKQDLMLLRTALLNHMKGMLSFQCQHCGYKMDEFQWRCPVCRHWDTIAKVA